MIVEPSRCLEKDLYLDSSFLECEAAKMIEKSMFETHSDKKRLGEHPLTFSMTPGHVALLTCFLRELGRSKPKMKRSNLVAKIPGPLKLTASFAPEKRPKGPKRKNVHLLSIQFSVVPC